jgi:glycosyltransferase involved in cell wall biosynthesis
MDSVAWSDDIHVYDSMSDDATIAIASARGARINQRPFDNWASHQNWGLSNIEFKHPWVFYIDADERMTPALVEAVKRAAAQPGEHVAFRVCRRDFFMGQWLKHVQASPYYMRLFRPEKMHYERLVNPVSIADGSVGSIDGYLNHFPFSKGISHWIIRHNSYSSFEAQQVQSNRKNGEKFSLCQAFFCRDFHRRRFHQKELFYRLPARPLVKFLLLYLGKRGFLDGGAGFTYAVLQAIYEYFILLKSRELGIAGAGPATDNTANPAVADGPALKSDTLAVSQGKQG